MDLGAEQSVYSLNFFPDQDPGGYSEFCMNMYKLFKGGPFCGTLPTTLISNTFSWNIQSTLEIIFQTSRRI